MTMRAVGRLVAGALIACAFALMTWAILFQR